MDIDQDNSDMEGAEKLVDSEEKKNLECTPKIIIIIVIANCVFVAVNIILIRFFSLSKTDHMTTIMNNYIKDYTKSAITEKRIMHLIKSNNNSNSSVRYQQLVEIQKLVFNATYEFLKSNSQFKPLLEKMINETYKHVLPDYKAQGTPINIIEDLYKVLTQEEDWRIYKLMDNYDLKTINDAIHNGKGDKYKEQLKIVILYGLINLPFQVFYFSNNETIKKNFQEAIIKKLNPDNINQTINHLMEEVDKNDKKLMVLGGDKEEEKKRIKATEEYINLVDTGLRTQLTPDENKTIMDYFEKYYIDNGYKELMKNCLSKDTSDIDTFISGGSKYIGNAIKIQEYLANNSFSVETANTVINYIELGIAKEKINIIRLSPKTNNDEIVYNKTHYFILYNVIDNATSGDNNTTRATTYSNAKAIKYLKERYPTFLEEKDYQKIILVSTQGDAERQLEAFNIASNLSSIIDENNQTRKWNEVIWNKNEEKILSGRDIINIMLEAMVKSYNLIATNYFESHKKDDLYNLACIYTDLINEYQKIE